MINTLILDLDNTVYPVKSVGEKLFSPLFDLLKKKEYNLDKETLEQAKQDIMRIPFQKVADKYDFPENLTEAALGLLRELVYTGEMHYYEDYPVVKKFNGNRFLVTTGFTKLQQSKIRQLGIESDFKDIFIVDPDKSSETKKDIFEKIMHTYHLKPEDILVIGDDPESEIKGAAELGIKTFLLDPDDKYAAGKSTYKAVTLGKIPEILKHN